MEDTIYLFEPRKWVISKLGRGDWEGWYYRSQVLEDLARRVKDSKHAGDALEKHFMAKEFKEMAFLCVAISRDLQIRTGLVSGT